MQRHGRRSDTGTLTLADFRFVPGERRNDLRLPCQRRILILTCGGGALDWSFHRVELFDCSPGGLGLMCGTELAAGEQFLAKLQLDKPRMLVYTVRHCATIGKRFKIGAELTDIVGAPDDLDGMAVRDAMMRASAAPAAPTDATAPMTLGRITPN
jgi:hypothetical protein